MLCLVLVKQGPGGLLVEDGVLVVHGGSRLPVVEVHVGQDLLAEVLHEAVDAEIKDGAQASLPPADGGRVGEVDQRAE